jgi:hypothetical protein
MNTVTVRVPIKLRRQGRRKTIVTPDGTLPLPARVDITLVKALARAFRWRKLLETGAYGTIAELAATEKINLSYVSRVLRLTLLAPDVVEAILEGRQGLEMTPRALMAAFPMEWER